MFCEKCGTKLDDSAKFCTGCGAKIGGDAKATEKIADNEIQLKVKPTFKFGYMVLPMLLIALIFAVCMGGTFAIMEPAVGLVIALAILIIFAIIIAIKTLLNKKQYKNYTYDFYKTKVVYRDSFLNMSEKEVKYKYIREVTMRQTFIQRFFNIGNIILFTNAETGFGNGIFIVNVENVQDVYKKIKIIIDE